MVDSSGDCHGARGGSCDSTRARQDVGHGGGARPGSAVVPARSPGIGDDSGPHGERAPDRGDLVVHGCDAGWHRSHRINKNRRFRDRGSGSLAQSGGTSRASASMTSRVCVRARSAPAVCSAWDWRVAWSRAGMRSASSFCRRPLAGWLRASDLCWPSAPAWPPSWSPSAASRGRSSRSLWISVERRNGSAGLGLAAGVMLSALGLYLFLY